MINFIFLLFHFTWVKVYFTWVEWQQEDIMLHWYVAPVRQVLIRGPPV